MYQNVQFFIRSKSDILTTPFKYFFAQVLRNLAIMRIPNMTFDLSVKKLCSTLLINICRSK